LSSSEENLAHRPIVTLTTDFGTNDHFVGAVKGVILDIVPEAAIVDISHAIQASTCSMARLRFRKRILTSRPERFTWS
jgi:S-adenosylmethionine hydrolase